MSEMDEMDLLRGLRAELPPARAEARAQARRQLTALIEEAARGSAKARPGPPGLRLPRLRARPIAAVVLACALALVTVVVSTLGAGSRVEPAAAAVLHRVASVAQAGGGPTVGLPSAGQFLYTKTKGVELEGWVPDGNAGSKTEPRAFTPHVPNIFPDARLALVPTVVEKWISPDGSVRQRETLGNAEFFSDSDQEEWEAAGSPPPASFGRATPGPSGDLVKEFTTRKWAHDGVLPDPAELSSAAPALRRAVEHNRVGLPWVVGFELRGAGTAATTGAGTALAPAAVTEQLFQILAKPTTTPTLRAAAFDALAEVPGVKLLTGVSDALGREGDAVTLLADGSGLRPEFIFDPRTATLLAQGETVTNPDVADRDVPEGTPYHQTVYLKSGIVENSGDVPGAR